MISASEVVTKFHYDPDGDRLTIQRIQDVEPIIEQNKRLMNEKPDNWKGEFHHVASIPNVVIEQYLKKGIDLLKDKAAMKRFLNDPDNRWLRTKPGRI